MKLIRTHDGMVGLDFDKASSPIWCTSIEQAVPIAKAAFNHLPYPPSLKEMDEEIRYAVDHMTKVNDTIADFGIFGSFLFSSKEEENYEEN